LDGLNYLAWLQSTILYIKSRGKIGYLNGISEEPKLDNTAHDKCEADNSTIRSWLMQPENSQAYLFLSTAKEIWDVAAQTYSKMGNAAQIYELKRQIHGTTQRVVCLQPIFIGFVHCGKNWINTKTSKLRVLPML
jgi:hypothetical protein